MPEPGYVEDVVNLSSWLLEKYHRESDLLVGPASTVEFTVHVNASDLAPSVEILRGLQLALDAAAVAVAYVEDTSYSGGYIDLDRLRRWAGGPSLATFDFEEDSDSNPSSGRFSLNPKTTNGRSRLLAIAGLATLCLMSVIGPIPGLVITGSIFGQPDCEPRRRSPRSRPTHHLNQSRQESLMLWWSYPESTVRRLDAVLKPTASGSATASEATTAHDR